MGLLQVVFGEIGHFQEMGLESGFQGHAAMDGHRKSDDAPLFSVDVVTALHAQEVPTVLFENLFEFFYRRPPSYRDFHHPCMVRFSRYSDLDG
jgi:hypothetical protein